MRLGWFVATLWAAGAMVAARIPAERDGVRQPPAPPRLRIAALLQRGRLAILDAERGSLVDTVPLGGGPSMAAGSLGVSKTGERVFATLVDPAQGLTAVVAVSLKAHAVERVASIADTIVYPWLVIGPRTGRVFLAAESGVRLVVVDPATGSTVRHASGRDPRVYRTVMWLAVAPTEDRLFVSYHGEATGVDWVELQGARFVACSESIARPPRVGCAPAHGRVAPYAGGLAVATGRDLRLLNANGDETRAFDTGLPPLNHFMEFVVDTGGRAAYALGPCASGGGLTRIPLTPSTPQGAPGVPLSASVCGDRIVLSDDGRLLAVAANAQLSIVDARTGQVLRTVAMPDAVVDVSFLGR